MKNTTYLALLTAVSMTAPANAVEPLESTGVERPAANGTTSDEIPPRPERSSDPALMNPTAVSEQARTAISIIKNTQAELDRIKEALKRIRRMNPGLSGEQLDEIRERLMQRARELITNAKNVSRRIEDLRPRLPHRSELLDAVRLLRDFRQSPEQAKTARDRE